MVAGVEVRLGVDVACTAAHQASLADETGRFLWQGWRFRTTTTDLEQLWAKIPDGVRVVVVMEPTRNAWAPLAAWFSQRGAVVSVVPPEQSADLRDYYNKHTKTDRLEQLSRVVDEGLRSGGDVSVVGGLVGGPFLVFAVDEDAAGSDEGDEVGGVDLAPSVLGGVEEFVGHRKGGVA